MRVWSEREGDDWEACVATSYARALLYGGVSMPAPYTQAERERLESAKDEPQNLATTDAMSIKVYKVKLRPVSVATIEQALARVGIGLCLTGKGSPGYQYEPGFAGLHEIFVVPISAGYSDVCDPLAPEGATSQVIANSKIAAWVKNAGKGVGPNDAREVKENEFMTTVYIRDYGAPLDVTFLAGTHVGVKLDGTKKSVAISRESHAAAEGIASIDQASYPNGDDWLKIINGTFAGYFVKSSPNASPTIPKPPTPTDCTTQINDAVAPIQAALDQAKADLAQAQADIAEFNKAQETLSTYAKEREA